jgi:glutathione S-transferase
MHRLFLLFDRLEKPSARSQRFVHHPPSLQRGEHLVYRLYIGNQNYSSWSLRPWILMRTLGIPFEQIKVQFELENYERFRKFSPNGRVPCLVDGDITVWDSLAITEYLAERHAGVWPSDHQARAYARCIAAEMHSSFGVLRDVCSMSCGIRVKLKEISSGLKKDIARIDELWTEGLRQLGGPFLAGNAFTAADAFYAPIAFRAQTYDLPLSATAKAYVARILDLQSMRQWYEAGLAETWREPAHEEDFVRVGTITADYRAVK